MKLGNINKLLIGILALGFLSVIEPVKAMPTNSDNELVAWRGRDYRGWNDNYYYRGGGVYFTPSYYNRGYYNNYYTPYYNSYYSPYYYNSYPYGGTGLYFGIGL